MRKEKILVVGANGQIGTVLTNALREAYGNDQVIASDLRPNQKENSPFEILNILEYENKHII